MTDWKYGTILRLGSDRTFVMVCGRGGRFTAEDGYTIHDGYWWGVTLSVVSPTGAWGQPGGRTWIVDDEVDGEGWDWEVVDD